ncbi:MAG TPA: PDZ domain-containing protein, partial [Clostridia bacterium]|nr:PDZ domain-containing protein [Clostridia bacterium]
MQDDFRAAPVISVVQPGSIASELGLVPGDRLLSINQSP